jgi:hypothetical protein
VICEDGIDTELDGQHRKLVAGSAMPHDETAASVSKRRVQLLQALAQKNDATVGLVGQRVEDLAVENEGAVNTGETL